jgi:hypothetical protein
MEVIKEGLLKVDPGLLLWTIITFLVLLLILWKAAWKPIVEALDAGLKKFAAISKMPIKQGRKAKDFLPNIRLWSPTRKKSFEDYCPGQRRSREAERLYC